MSRFRPADLGDEHSLLADLVDELVEARVEPNAETLGADSRLVRELAGDLGEHGLLAITVPEDRGGSGADLGAATLALVGLARGSATVAAVAATGNTVAAAFMAGDGPAAVTWDAGGPGVGFGDAAQGRVDVRPSGDGWLIDGSLERVEAPVCPDALVLVFEAAGEVVAALLPANRPGVEVGQPARVTGLAGAGTRTVILTDVRIGGEDIIGGVGAVTAARQFRMLAAACVAAGVSRAAIDAAVGYMDERRQFGTRLADMAGLRMMVAKAAARLRRSETSIWDLAGRPAVLGASGAQACAEVAAECAESSISITTDSLQLHGGYGYTTDFPVERYFRDALSIRASLGGSRVPLELVAGGWLGPVRA